MAVEVFLNIDEQGKKKAQYPYIGRSDAGNVVLFTCEKTGVNLNVAFYELGHYSKEWQESLFTPLSPSESITLRNA